VQEEAAADSMDRRVRRTRQLLLDALSRLLSQKCFEHISIADIARESTLNRATFYDHFPDKFALLDCLAATRFAEVVDRRDIRFDGCEGALRKLALGVCCYLEEMPWDVARGQWQAETPLETAIVPVIRALVLEGLGHGAPKPWVAAELLAGTVAWAIYGAAKEWIGRRDRVPVEQIAEAIEKMLSPVFLSLG
jgi:AcrR family transcriptional regulator